MKYLVLGTQGSTCGSDEPFKGDLEIAVVKVTSQLYAGIKGKLLLTVNCFEQDRNLSGLRFADRSDVNWYGLEAHDTIAEMVGDDFDKIYDDGFLWVNADKIDGLKLEPERIEFQTIEVDVWQPPGEKIRQTFRWRCYPRDSDIRVWTEEMTLEQLLNN